LDTKFTNNRYKSGDPDAKNNTCTKFTGYESGDALMPDTKKNVYKNVVMH
jgi:hypothetical protein